MSYSHKLLNLRTGSQMSFMDIWSEGRVAHDWQPEPEVGAGWEAEPRGLCTPREVSARAGLKRTVAHQLVSELQQRPREKKPSRLMSEVLSGKRTLRSHLPFYIKYIEYLRMNLIKDVHIFYIKT